MNLRMKIVEQLMSSLFDDDREYLADCEDAALEIMKLIAADKSPSAETKERSELAAEIIRMLDAFDTLSHDIKTMTPNEFQQLTTWSLRLASLCSVHIVPSSDKE